MILVISGGSTGIAFMADFSFALDRLLP